MDALDIPRSNRRRSLMPDEAGLEALAKFLGRDPSIQGAVGKGFFEDGRWLTKFVTTSLTALAWHVVQELGTF